MLKYLIIQLDDTAVSFCHYNNKNTRPKLIGLDKLKEALFWSMKENLSVQFLYPDYALPPEYNDVISSVDHVDIVSDKCADNGLRENADIVVFDTWAATQSYPFSENQAYVLRTTLGDLFSNSSLINAILPSVSRLNIVITDVEKFDKDSEAKYSHFLDNLGEAIAQEYKNSHDVQINILTDRLSLKKMNNCNAGVESITLAPDGMFYICPGYYLDKSFSVGDVTNGLDIKNPQLYRLDHAPICRLCDAWHCKRCTWLNHKMTLEVNTPSREQCVMAHIEREASRKLLERIRSFRNISPQKQISKLDYLDPFEIAFCR